MVIKPNINKNAAMRMIPKKNVRVPFSTDDTEDLPDNFMIVCPLMINELDLANKI